MSGDVERAVVVLVERALCVIAAMDGWLKSDRKHDLETEAEFWEGEPWGDWAGAMRCDGKRTTAHLPPLVVYWCWLSVTAAALRTQNQTA